MTDNGGTFVKISFTAYRVNPETGAETILGTYSFNRALDPTPEEARVIATGDVWKFLDNGTDQGINWRTDPFSDNTWKEGASPLGYVSTGVRTPVSFGSNASAKHITTYFRKKISITDPCRIKAAYLELSVDDGAVVYLNNVEIGRANFNYASYNYLTTASAVATNVPQTFRFCIDDPSIFKNGENILAAEVHQHSGTSSDLFFNLHLSLSLTTNRVQITQQPFDVTSALNGEAVFTVTTLNSNATYQWQSDSGAGFENLSNSSQFSGVESPSLKVSGITISNNNQQFRCVVAENGCSSVSDPAILRVNFPTPVDNIQPETAFSLYPNPAKNEIYVKVGTYFLGTSYIIYDLYGKEIAKGVISSQETKIPVASYKTGIHTLKISKNKIYYFKFLKE